ncbi:unnamed protein product [Effrenium voratum]|nr:unnamed protein product [Effrenium voratum]
MAPSEFAWKPRSLRSEPWAAEAFAGAVLRKRPVGEAKASLCEVRANGCGETVSKVTFRADGACEVKEFKGWAWCKVGVFRSCSEVQWRWEKAGGRWKVWVESDTGETVVVAKTFETSSPQLELCSLTRSRLEVSLLPLQPVRSPQPSQAELRVQELMAEVQHERAQKANLQQQCDELKEQLTTITQEKAQAVQKKDALQQDKQDLQHELEQCRRNFALLTHEKAHETHKVEGLQQEKLDLQQQLEQSRHDFALISQQQLEQSRQEFVLLMQEKAQATQEKDALQQEKQDLQQQLEKVRRYLMSASQKAPTTQRKLQEVMQQLFELKEHCDAVFDFAQGMPPAPGLVAAVEALSCNASGAGDWAVLGQPEDLQSASDASSTSAKCYLPSAALPDAEGRGLLFVAGLKPGDRVLAKADPRGAVEVVQVMPHAAGKKPYDVVDLHTHQGCFTVSSSHLVAVPGDAGTEERRADALRPGEFVFVGSMKRELKKVTHRKERTDLFEIIFDTDVPLEMFHVPSWGMLTFGSPRTDAADVDADVAASSGGRLVSEEVDMLCLVGTPGCEDRPKLVLVATTNSTLCPAKTRVDDQTVDGVITDTVRMALVKTGDQAIYEPFRDELFTARSTRGAFLNGEIICVSGTPRLAEAVVASGCAPDPRSSAACFRAMAHLAPKTRTVRILGSAAINFAWLACGRLDGWFEVDLNCWDTAAGVLLVQEAGGIVTDCLGNDYTLKTRPVCASNGHIHFDLLLGRHWACTWGKERVGPPKAKGLSIVFGRTLSSGKQGVNLSTSIANSMPTTSDTNYSRDPFHMSHCSLAPTLHYYMRCPYNQDPSWSTL